MALGPYDQDPINFRPSNLGPVPAEGEDPIQQLLLETIKKRINPGPRPPLKFNAGASYLAAVHPEMLEALTKQMESQNTAGQQYDIEQAQLPSMISAYSGTERSSAASLARSSDVDRRLANLEVTKMLTASQKRDQFYSGKGVETLNPDGSPRPEYDVQREAAGNAQADRNQKATFDRARIAHMDALTRFAHERASKTSGLSPLALTKTLQSSYKQKVDQLMLTDEYWDADPSQQEELMQGAQQEAMDELESNLAHFSTFGGVTPQVSVPSPSAPSTGNPLLDAIEAQKRKRQLR